MWETIWDWMRGGHRGVGVAQKHRRTEYHIDPQMLATTMRSGGQEVERIGAGYELAGLSLTFLLTHFFTHSLLHSLTGCVHCTYAALVRDGSPQAEAALQVLLSLARDNGWGPGALSNSNAKFSMKGHQRAAMYGLASAGDPAVAAIAAALEQEVAAGNDVAVTSLAYSLGESVRSVDTAAGSIRTLTSCISAMNAALTDTVNEDDRAQKNTAVASCVTALGCIGERVVAPPPDTSTTTQEQNHDVKSELITEIAKALLPWTMTGGHGVQQVGATHGQGQAREGAAAGLLRLASGGLRAPTDPRTVAQLIDPLSPAHHDDDRYVPALCAAALQRLRTHVNASGEGSEGRVALESLMAGVEPRWRELATEAAAAPPEPWLKPGSADHVRWL